MSFGLAAPLALAALAALVVPIVLHLVRRAEQRDTPFAALKFLRPAGLPRRRIRVAELGLLLLRCLLLAALAVMLALPFLRREAPARHVVAVVAPVTAAQARSRVPSDAATELVWLAQGFPSAEQAIDPQPRPHASLLRELDATLPADSRLDVVVPATLDGLDGERPALSRAVGWHVVADARSEPAARAREPDVVALRVPADDATQARYVGAIAHAWDNDGWRTVPVSGDAIPDGARYAVWLGTPPSEAALQWTRRGGTMFVAGDTTDEGDVLVRGDDGAPLVRSRREGQGRVVALAAPFVPAALPRMNDPAFPAELAAWLRGEAAPPGAASADAVRPGRRDAAHVPPTESLARWFAWLAAALFALERAWASGLARRAARA